MPTTQPQTPIDAKRARVCRPLHILCVMAALILFSQAYTLHINLLTFLTLPHQRPDTLPFRDLRLLRRHAFRTARGPSSRRVVIITASTKHYASHVRNLLCGVRAATGGRTPVLFALDAKMARFGPREGFPTIYAKYRQAPRQGQRKPYTFNSVPFNDLSKLKLRAVRDALLAGVDVLFSDVDVVWCDNAAQLLADELRKVSWAEVLIQNGRSHELQWPVEPNTGFFYVKRSRMTIALFDHLVNRSATDPTNDQFLFKRYVCERHVEDGDAVNNTVSGRATHSCLWRKKLGVHILSLVKYPNGHWPMGVPYKNLEPGQLLRACQRKKIAVFHNNYCDARRKVERMDQSGLWSVRRCNGECQPMGPDEYGA